MSNDSAILSRESVRLNGHNFGTIYETHIPSPHIRQREATPWPYYLVCPGFRQCCIRQGGCQRAFCLSEDLSEYLSALLKLHISTSSATHALLPINTEFAADTFIDALTVSPDHIESC